MKTTSKLCAGLAVAFALTTGEASAVTVFKNINTNLQAGGSAYSGQIDISSYLAGGAYKATNAKVTAIGGSNATISNQNSLPSSPVLVDQTAREMPGYYKSVSCGFFTCYEWVDPYTVYDRVFETYEDALTLDVVPDVLRIDVGEGMGADQVNQQFSAGAYETKASSTYGSQAEGWDRYDRKVRNVTNIWAGPVSPEALLTLNDLAALNANGRLDFSLDAPVGKIAVSYVKLDFDLMSAVPEPATWAMMLVGFFGAGSALRVRRRQGLTA